MKEAENQHHMLEEKLHEAEKQKQDLEEQNLKVQASLEEQVFLSEIFFLIDICVFSLLLNIVQL